VSSRKGGGELRVEEVALGVRAQASEFKPASSGLWPSRANGGPRSCAEEDPARRHRRLLVTPALERSK
jgi:hypothetical protein